MKYLALLPFVGLVACSDFTAPTAQSLTPSQPRGEVLVNERLPVDITVTSCSGETVTMQGIEHILFSLTFPKSGGEIGFISIDYSVSGYGAVTGAQYHGSLSIRQQLEQVSASVFRTGATLHLVSQGSIPNTLVGFDVRATANVDGTSAVDEVNFTSRCE